MKTMALGVFTAAVLLAPRVVAQTYSFTTLAGLAGYPGSIDGTGGAARFNYPSGIAVDGSGNVFVADGSNNTIRKVTAAGVVTTVAGTAGSSGSVDGTGSAARFNGPSGVAVDGSGNVFVADTYSQTIRRITPAGVVTTLAGMAGVEGSADGTGSAARFFRPSGVAVDAGGNVFVVDGANHTIRKITAGGVVTTLAGAPGAFGIVDGTGSAARFYGPISVAVDGSGNLFVVGGGDHAIRKITAGGVVTTVAGMLGIQGSVDGTGSAARFRWVWGVAVDGSGNVFVTENSHHTVRRMAANGVVTTVGGLAGTSGNADGTGSAARFNYPSGIAVDGNGNLFVADDVSHTIRKGMIVVAPVITTQPQSQTVTAGASVTFSVVATGTPAPTFQWRKNGTNIAGATSATLALGKARADLAGSYSVVVTNSAGSVTSNAAALTVNAATAGTVVGWGGINNVPDGLSAVLAVGEAGAFRLALKTDGTVVAWGQNNTGQTNVPAGLSGVVSIAAGVYHCLALKADGMVVAWGDDPSDAEIVPAGLSGVVAIAAGNGISLALKADGTVGAWGWSVAASVPAGLSGVVAIAACNGSCLALKADGTIVAWGGDSFGRTSVPAGLTGVVAIAAGHNHSLALKADGTVVAWGDNTYSQTSVPAGLSGVVAIAGGGYHSLALKADGAVVAWGNNNEGQASVPAGLARVFAISAGGNANMAIVAPAPPSITTQPAVQAVTAGANVTLTVVASGTPAPTYQWRKNGTNIAGATGTSLTLSNVQAADAGTYSVVVTNSAGSVTSNNATLTVNAAPTVSVSVNGNAISGSGSAAINLTTVASDNINTVSFTLIWDPAVLTYVSNAIGAAVPTDASATSIRNTTQTSSGRLGILLALSPGTSFTSGTKHLHTVNFTAATTAASTALAFGDSPTARRLIDANGATITSAVFTGATVATTATLSPPSITAQPQGLTVNQGSSASFSVTASSTATMTYQWRKDGADISGGATSSTYSISSAQPSHAGSYTVVVTNSAGSVTSSAATLTVNVPPAITTQPAAQSALAGSTVTFTVVATGTPAPTYQWRKDGTNLSGATGTSLILSNVQAADAGTYSVVVTNSAGAVTSNGASLTITQVVVAPTIATQPASQSVAAGGSGSFVVAVSGTAPFTYQWRRDGTVIAAVTGATLGLSNVQSADAGDYTVTVSNSAGSVTSAAARLTVQTPPTISTHPVSQNIPLGGTATLTVVASGTEPFTYQWRKDGTALAGATGASLTLSNLRESDSGNYVVAVSNAVGTSTSNVAAVTVSVPPAITAQPADQSVALGSTVTLSVTATGTAPLTYAWRKDGAAVPGASGATLMLSSIQTAQAGAYTVLVSNAAGSVLSRTAVVSVAAAPEITRQPASMSVTVGSTATFSVEAVGADPLRYQWQRDGSDLPGRTSRELTIPNAQTSDAAGYRVVISNASGSATSTMATLSVTTTAVAPTIAAQPESRAAAAGSNVIFRVGVSGTAPFTYQWRRNGAAISGETSDTLILAGVSAGNEGSYTVLVSNSQGSVTSAAATLTISEAPVITTPPANRSVAYGTNTSFSVVATGTAPLAYQWFKDGRAIAGATNAVLPRDAVTDGDAGEYYVTVSNAGGTVTSRRVTLEVSGAANRLVNLSVRTMAGAGDQTLIVGFVVAGSSGSKQVLVRGVGPSLSAFGISGFLADPQLALYRGSIQVANNDNWGDSLVADQVADAGRRVGAFAFDVRSRDAAIFGTLSPGTYSAQVISQAGSGIALLELYDADANPGVRLVNVSARSQVGTGANILIAGFSIAGNTSKRVLLRAVGPTLAAFGVGNVLADPQMSLLRGTDVLDANDDWWRDGGAVSLPPVFGSVGAFALATQSRDAALVATLPPGSYTAQVSGAGGTTGVALVEVYEVP